MLAERAVRSVFTPVVHLKTGLPVGFEALARGPEGSELEAPATLIAAASRARRLGELDWLCRASAMEAIVASELHPSLSWFVNVEPAGLAMPCPEELLPTMRQARGELRVVLEVVQRGSAPDVAGLIRAADQARADSWGVALDDVGADERSLALLPLIRPDVIKLDMALVQRHTDSSIARMVARVGAYAERREAVILAEGIETEDDQHLALLFGATYGQGYLYGRPGPLPASVPRSRHVVPLRQQFEPVVVTTAFDVLASGCEPRTATRADLLRITGCMEAEAIGPQQDHVVIALLDGVDRRAPDVRRRYAEIADHTALTVVLDEGADDWALVVISGYYGAAFAARRLGAGRGADARYEFTLTYDLDIAVTAARTLLKLLDPALSDDEVPTGSQSLRPGQRADALHRRLFHSRPRHSQYSQPLR